jgi:hypothetical protein
MHSESFGLEPSDRPVRADVFVREEPDEDEDEQHEDDSKEDDNGDGYSEWPFAWHCCVGERMSVDVEWIW